MTDFKDGGWADPGEDGGWADPSIDGGLADTGTGETGATPGSIASGRPVGMVKITLDFCGRTFGVSPCLATGTPCYNTWKTCKYLSAFLRESADYKFSFSDASIPFDGVRPYISPEGVKINPTEIKSGLAFDDQPLRTVSGRITVRFIDEPDTDVGIDPYWSDRSEHPGTFFKKLIARNPNYKGRYLRYYEGAMGDAEGDLVLRWAGKIQNISVKGPAVTVEAADAMVDFSKIDVPPKIECKLAGDVDDVTAAAMTLSDVTDVPPQGAILIEEEVVAYTSVNETTKQIVGLTRGAYGTTASEHGANQTVGLVAVFGPKNPWSILREDLIMGYGGLPVDLVDQSAFTYWMNWPGGDIPFQAVVTQSVKLDKLITEIADVLDARIWQNENQKLTVRRNMPNQPGREYFPLSDADNIVNGTGSLDTNEKSRITRCLIYWAKRAIGADNDPSIYDRLDIGVDSDAESSDGYGDVVKKEVFCRWIGTSYIQEELAAQYVKNLAMRQVSQSRDARPLVAFELNLKDNALETGHHVKLTTDEILLPDGNPISDSIFQVIKRERKKNRIGVTLMRVSNRRVMFIAPVGTPDFDEASDAEKEYGFICQEDGTMPDGTPGYIIW